ncbi:MAG TPA: lysoplasmalogenase [Candidatus Merdivicinus intestinavium]|nr:lysoplasmalogenase [Candidatus Merdivicinus intestinavium]
MSWIFFALYGVCSAAHLWFCLRPGRRWQDFTKVLLMPLLLTAAIWAGSPLLLQAALFLGWLGDVFLLYPERPALFLAGLGCFLAGHVCYIPALFPQRRLDVLPLVLLGAVLAAVGAGLFFSLRRDIPRGMTIPSLAYLIVILAMAWTAFATLKPAFLAGAALFIASDYILARGLFRSKGRYGDFVVMLTYLSAQFLLTMGLCGFF